MKKILALFLILSSTMAAASAAAQIEDDAKIDIELRSADLGETLQSFADIGGRELDMDPAVTGTVTVDFERIPWQEALSEICAAHDLTCELLTGEPPLLRVRPAGGLEGPPREPGLSKLLDLALKGADLRETVSTFGMITGRRVVVDDRVSGKVTLDVRGVPWPVLLEEICAVGGCRVEWDEDTLHVLPLEDGAGRRADLRLDGAGLREALERIAGLPIFGPFGAPEVELVDELEARLDATFEDASWSEMVSSVCASAGCQWSLRYGAPSRLEVRALDPRFEAEQSFEARATTLAEAAAELAALVGLAARLDDGLDPAAPVTFPGGTMTWRQAMARLCRQVACTWRLGERHLTVSSRIEPLALRPLSSTEGVILQASFTDPAGARATALARFTWAEPIVTLAAEGTAHEGRLSWIPFAPDLHFLLPVFARCDGQQVRDAEVLPLVRLPLAELQTVRRGGAILELEPALDGAAGSGAGLRPSRCLDRSAGTIEAAFLRGRGGSEASGERTVAELANRVGAYLLVTPPGAGPRPMAAVVALGTDARGRQRVALVRPGTHRAGEVEHLAFGRDETVRRSLRAGDGALYTLELSEPAR